jgi:hypothetical protein
MRRESTSQRAAWTAFVEGQPAAKASKYGAERAGKYASKREAAYAAKLDALQRGGVIRELREQHPIVLVPGDGKLRPIKYIADFTYIDKEGEFHVVDCKGFKTQVYRLKKRIAALLLRITIEEA